MLDLFKNLTKLFFHGTMILMRSLRKTLRDEIRSSNEMAKRRRTAIDAEERPEGDGQPTLEEAMKILNVDRLSRKEVERNFNILFTLNDRANGGSFYVQSKVFRAKQVIDREFNRLLKEEQAKLMGSAKGTRRMDKKK